MLRLADGGEGAERHRGDRDEDDDLLPVGGDRLEGAHGDAHDQRHGRHLRRGGEEGGDRRRRALIDVGRPHVERHGRDLEGEAGQHEDEAEDQAELALAAAERRGDRLEAGVAGVAVDQADAVEQHARGQRAEDEIFQAGFGRAQVVAVDGGEHIDAPATAVRGRDRARSCSLAEIISIMPSVRRAGSAPGYSNLSNCSVSAKRTDMTSVARRADQRQHLHEAGEGIGDEGAAEGRAVARCRRSARRRRRRPDGDGKAGDQPARARPAKDADHQEHHRADREDKLRRR